VTMEATTCPERTRVTRSMSLALPSVLQAQNIDLLHAAVAMEQEGVVGSQGHPRRTGLREVFQVDDGLDVMIRDVDPNSPMRSSARIYPLAIVFPHSSCRGHGVRSRPPVSATTHPSNRARDWCTPYPLHASSALGPQDPWRVRYRSLWRPCPEFPAR